MYAIVFIIVILFAWLYARWWEVRNYWAKRGVPHDPPHPLLGSLTFLQRENPVSSNDHVCQACWDLAQGSSLDKPRQLGHRSVCLRCGRSLATRASHLLHTSTARELRIFNVKQEWILPRTTLWMRRMYSKFKSPYVGIWLFYRPGLIVNCPELARRILVKDADNFRNRFLSSGQTDPVGSLNLFTVNDPVWTYIRRKLSAVFTGAKLRAVQAIIVKKSQDLMERIRVENEKGELIDLKKVLTDYTTDVTGEAAFGVSSEATRTGDSFMRKVTREFMTYNLYRGLCWSSIFFFPKLVDIFGFSFFPKDTTAYLKYLFREMVQQRGGYEKEVKECRDLLDALIKLKQDASKDDEEINEDVLLAQAAIFLFGGFDTTGSTLTWVAYEMAHHPQYQDKLYEELLEAKNNSESKEFDSYMLAELPYLNAVIKETLRKFPSMGWLDRIASHNYVIDSRLTIPAGTVIYVNGTAMQMDPDYFPEPDIFNPERFMPGNDNVKPYTYLPFGEGPRSCIGQRFAYQSMRFVLASLFLEYKLRPLPHSPQPNQVHVETQGLFYSADEKLSVLFSKR